MKQPVHICMKDNRLVYRSGNGVNGNLISRVSQGVPLSRPTGHGTMGQDGTLIISLKIEEASNGQLYFTEI